ncbi:hypothetical protein CU254_42480 (plasmid) [Amycolatopsis sp. AA4]|uniref:hypothetical protein n=1 Tax=Actinomycetes TaxID=1760 RepID=UPI0001B5766E|nr:MULTISPECIES: hypothetical protein [Actinomycetes]ATY17256.1 hypothetical protein CU254_42480 [Amycolatopsis sp. AA4]
MTIREQHTHPLLIDLDTGDEYEWITEPAGGGEPGYAHVEDHDWAWPREAIENGYRIAEVDDLAPEQVAALRARYLAGDADEDQERGCR